MATALQLQKKELDLKEQELVEKKRSNRENESIKMAEATGKTPWAIIPYLASTDENTASEGLRNLWDNAKNAIKSIFTVPENQSYKGSGRGK